MSAALRARTDAYSILQIVSEPLLQLERAANINRGHGLRCIHYSISSRQCHQPRSSHRPIAQSTQVCSSSNLCVHPPYEEGQPTTPRSHDCHQLNEQYTAGRRLRRIQWQRRWLCGSGRTLKFRHARKRAGDVGHAGDTREGPQSRQCRGYTRTTVSRT